MFANECTSITSERTLVNGGGTLNANMCLEGVEINIWDKQWDELAEIKALIQEMEKNDE